MNRTQTFYPGITLFFILIMPALLVAQQARLISIDPAGTTGVGATSSLTGLSASADGRFVVFASSSAGVTPDTDTNGNFDVFVRDTALNTTELVSVSTAGNSTGNNASEGGSISADGRYVVFFSSASDLVGQAVPAGPAVYMRDLQANVTTPISLTAAGAIGSGDLPIISANGLFVVFRSTQQLLPLDTNIFNDVYVRDMQNGITKLVSVNAAGTGSGDEASLHSAAATNNIISDDGRYVVFQSGSSNMSILTNPPPRAQIYRRDLQLGITKHISVNPDETAMGNNHSEAPSMSRDGRYIAYYSDANNLTAADTNNSTDVFLRDLDANTTTRVSTNNGGAGGSGNSLSSRITPDGRYTVFTSVASLLPNDTLPGTADIYVYDRVSGTNRLASVNLSGVGAGGANTATISSDGRYVAFNSMAPNLVTFDNQVTTAVFVRDLATGRTALMSRQNNQARRNLDTAQFPTISADGRSVVYQISGNPSIVPQTTSGSQTYQTKVAFLAGSDFSGDGRAELAVFRPSDGVWYTLDQSGGAFNATGWGQSGDRIVPGDYDGDRKIDHAVFRGGNWFILGSASGSFVSVNFGLTTDVPVPADYDGDGATDIAVFRDGVWHMLESGSGGYRNFQWGAAGDLPVTGDYDRDGRTDLAVFRGGFWYILQSESGTFRSVQFGIAGDKPVQADYDGDLRTDLAVFRGGIWYFLLSINGQFRAVQWGLAGDRPVPANYFGTPTDAAFKLGVYRDGNWFTQSLQNASVQTYNFGLGSDTPVPSAFIP